MLARACWLLVQSAWSLPMLVFCLVRRRGAPWVFTHHQDRDAQGRDQQMGALLAALRGRCVEVARVPLTAASWRRLRAPFLPYAVVVAAAALLPPWPRARTHKNAARARVCRLLLRLLRPRAVFLIDESGSGQPLVTAARACGIRSVGVQHGDFLVGSPSYDGAGARGVAPVDVLCVWSEWFRARLFAISDIYTPANTRVTGRLRDGTGTAPAPPTPFADGVLRIAVLTEADARFAGRMASFVEVLARAEDAVCTVQPHPATGTPGRPLLATLAWCDVAVGMRSSALLEALWMRRAVVIVDPGEESTTSAAATLDRELGLPQCADPNRLLATCRAAVAQGADIDRARAVVWGQAQPPAVDAVLAAGER
jgi:hypothetical protein